MSYFVEFVIYFKLCPLNLSCFSIINSLQADILPYYDNFSNNLFIKSETDRRTDHRTDRPTVGLSVGLTVVGFLARYSAAKSAAKIRCEIRCEIRGEICIVFRGGFASLRISLLREDF